jgi:hypothetical protein
MKRRNISQNITETYCFRRRIKIVKGLFFLRKIGEGLIFMENIIKQYENLMFPFI